MKLSIRLKYLYCILLSRTGLIKKRIRRLSKNNFLVLMYHRILPEEQVSDMIEPGMYVSSQVFEMHLKYLKDNFEVLPVSSLLTQNIKDLAQQKSRPIVYLTFDDGWHDFYKYAFPILKKYLLPAINFLPTGFINTTNWFWTDRLAYLLSNRKITKLNSKSDIDPRIGDPVMKIEGLRGKSWQILDEAITVLKGFNLEDIEVILDYLGVMWGIDHHIHQRVFLDWEEIANMANAGLVEFGSHTHTHQILDTISDDNKILNELEQSKAILTDKGLVENSVVTLCYPNGNYNPQIIEIARKTGYNLAFTTKPGWESLNYNALEIHRTAVHNDMTSSLPLFTGRLAGFI